MQRNRSTIRAKQVLFTSNVLSGTPAAAWGLATCAVPQSALEAEIVRLAERIASVPSGGHLAMHAMVINQVLQTMDLDGRPRAP